MNRKSNLPKEYLEKGGPGRPKGVPNKVSGCMKVEVWKVFNLLQNNVDEAGNPIPEEKRTSLATMAKKDPLWFYTVFGARLLPKDVTLRVINSFDDLSDVEKENVLRNWEEKNRQERFEK